MKSSMGGMRIKRNLWIRFGESTLNMVRLYLNRSLNISIRPGQVLMSKAAEVLEKDSGLRALGQTTERNHKQLLNWIVNNKPLGKYDFIFHRDDFVSSARYSGKEHYFEDLIMSTIDRWRTGPHKVRIFLRNPYILAEYSRLSLQMATDALPDLVSERSRPQQDGGRGCIPSICRTSGHRS
jgi:hypothetical protein